MSTGHDRARSNVTGGELHCAASRLQRQQTRLETWNGQHRRTEPAPAQLTPDTVVLDMSAVEAAADAAACLAAAATKIASRGVL